MSGTRDPGDAVPPGVAPQSAVPLTEEDRAVRDRLERLPEHDLDTGDVNESQTDEKSRGTPT